MTNRIVKYKIGDQVYFTDRIYDTVKEYTVKNIIHNKYGSFYYQIESGTRIIDIPNEKEHLLHSSYDDAEYFLKGCNVK